MPQNENDCPEGTLINEVQLLLAENRTDMAMLRTGIAVFGLPLSVIGLLIATSNYWEFNQVVLDMFIPLVIICVILVALAFYLIFLSVVRIRRHHKLIGEIKKNNKTLDKLLD